VKPIRDITPDDVSAWTLWIADPFKDEAASSMPWAHAVIGYTAGPMPGAASSEWSGSWVGESTHGRSPGVADAHEIILDGLERAGTRRDSGPARAGGAHQTHLSPDRVSRLP
jgi:hypothetical protein